MPMKLERQLEMLAEHPVHDVAYCDAKIINERGKETGERFTDEFPVPGDGSGRLFEEFCTRNFVNMQTAFLRRDCIADSGYFDERIKWVEDWWFWIKISYRHSFAYTNEALAKYRVHPKSTGRVRKKANIAHRTRVYHRILQSYPQIPRQLKSNIYYHIGMALSELGKINCARQCFMQSMKLWPGNLRALYRFCFCLCN
jgi:hypothetical protein